MSVKVKRGAPSLTEQLLVVHSQIQCLRKSYREKDGVIRDQNALHEIRCFQETARWLRELRKQWLEKRK